MGVAFTCRTVQIKRDLDCNSTGVLVQAGATQIVNLIISNATAATAAYLKLYDKATAGTSSDTPVKTIFLPAASTIVVPIPRQGVEGEPSSYLFANGLSYRSVTGVADNNTTAPASNGTVLNLEYY